MHIVLLITRVSGLSAVHTHVLEDLARSLARSRQRVWPRDRISLSRKDDAIVGQQPTTRVATPVSLRY